MDKGQGGGVLQCFFISYFILFNIIKYVDMDKGGGVKCLCG